MAEAQSYPKYIRQIPYTDPAARLQTFDLWLPRPLSESDPQSSVVIVYIHGGAWRDPAQDALCIQPTLAHLSPTTTPRIAAIASLDYRLSRYTSHPTDPSLPNDASRNAQWPDHIQDVRAALAYLRTAYGVGATEGGYKWIGVGHSCGATLLAQLVAHMGRDRDPDDDDDDDIASGAGPDALLLMAGIYSVPLLLSNHQPPACPAHIAEIYQDFVAGAFGPNTDSSLYSSVSPSSGTYTADSCPGLKRIVLAYSPQDELIEMQQREVMLETLVKCGWVEPTRGGERVVELKDLSEGHDHVWEDGSQVAGLISDAVGKLFGANKT